MSTFRFIRIQCQSCDVQLRVEYEHVGKRVRCPACEAIRQIPREDEVQEMLEFMASQRSGALPADVVPTLPPGAMPPETAEDDASQVVDESADIHGTDAASPDDVKTGKQATKQESKNAVQSTTEAEEVTA